MNKQNCTALLKYTFFFIFVFATSSVFAKDTVKANSDLPFRKGTKLLGLSVGASIDNYAGDLRPHPVPAITYDQGFFDNVGIGNIGIGGVAAYKFLREKYNWGNYDQHSGSFYFGLRGTYHFTYFKNRNIKFDPYAGVMLGVKITHSEDSWYKYYYTKAYLAKGFFIGARYVLNERFSAFSELGYNISFVSIGIFANL